MLLEAYGEKIHKKLARLAIAAGLADEDTPCSEAAGQFIRAVKDMKKRFGIGVHIPEIQETDIPKLAHYADKEANPLYPVPVLMDAAELESFYRILMTETGETSEETIVEKGDTGHDRTGN
jgi:alcohol dehydrogenase class IV